MENKVKHSTIYRVLRRMIERGETENIQEKLDVFMAADRITIDEYNELRAMLIPA